MTAYISDMIFRRTCRFFLPVGLCSLLSCNFGDDPVATVATDPITSVTVAPGNGEATISWTPGENSGGLTVVVTAVEDTSRHCTTTGPSFCVVTGLTNGESYTFTVKVLQGEGPISLYATSPVIPLGVPGAPTAVKVQAGNGQAVLSWNPSLDNGSPVTDYSVTSVGSSAVRCSTTTNSCMVTGLTNGKLYLFLVAASNSLGTGPSSAAVSVIPATIPSAPTAVTAEAGHQRATISWIPDSDGGQSIQGYRVTAVEDTALGCTNATTSCTVLNLANGTPYSFRVRAWNAVGMGPESESSMPITPQPVAPDAPGGLTGTPDSGRVTLSWNPPAFDGGLPITGYIVTGLDAPGKGCETDTLRSCTVTGLTNGAYYRFRVRAVNAVGWGVASAPSALIRVVGLPEAPTNVTAYAGLGFAQVNWTAPVSNGGSLITQYRAMVQADTTKVCYGSGNDSSCVVTGLVRGAVYRFVVTATNGYVWSPLSLPSDFLLIP